MFCDFLTSAPAAAKRVMQAGGAACVWENAWVFLARRCPICKEISDVPCTGCVAKLEPARYLECAPEFELGCRALFAYTEVSSRLVLTLKYQRDTNLVRWLAPQLAGLIPKALLGGTKRVSGSEIDCVTWIPASAKNRRKRGYDQAEMLAKAVAREVGLPCRRLLKRNRDRAQGDRDFKGRLEGPSLTPTGSLLAGNSAISSSPTSSTARFSNTPKSVLIVDDVVTTGSSLRRAAEVLRQTGIPRIGAIAVTSRAKVPRHT